MPVAAAVKVWSRVTRLLARSMATILAPAGMPVPSRVRPTARPVTSAKVRVVPPWAPETTDLVTCSPSAEARKPTVFSRDMPETGRFVSEPAAWAVRGVSSVRTLPLMPVITEPGAMPERIAKVPEPGASRLAERVTVLPLIAAMVAPVGMPVRAVSVPLVAAVVVALSEMILPLIAVMVVPAGMPTPVTIWPTARPVLSATVTKPALMAPGTRDLRMASE